MQGKRFKNQSQDQPAQTGRASGAHFAKTPSKSAPQGAPAPARPYPQVQSIQLPQPVQQTNRQMVTGEFAKVTPSQRRSNQVAPQQQAKRPQPGQPGQVRGAAQNPTSRKISPLVSAAIPRVSSDADDSAALRRAVITGVSGSMKKIPSNTPARKVSGSNKAYSRYSNGYFDRPEAKQLTDYVAAFQTEPTVGAPAYSWMAFAVYGALSCVASVGWAVVAMVSGAAPLRGASPLMFAGLVILALIVVCAVVCAAVTSAATLRTGRFEPADVWASAVGKSALVLLGCLVVWVVCAAVVG